MGAGSVWLGWAAVPGRPARDGAPAPVGSGSRAPGGPRCSRPAGEWQRGLARRGALFCPAAEGRTSASLASPFPYPPVLPVGKCPGAQPSPRGPSASGPGKLPELRSLPSLPTPSPLPAGRPGALRAGLGVIGRSVAFGTDKPAVLHVFRQQAAPASGCKLGFDRSEVAGWECLLLLFSCAEPVSSIPPLHRFLYPTL